MWPIKVSEEAHYLYGVDLSEEHNGLWMRLEKDKKVLGTLEETSRDLLSNLLGPSEKVLSTFRKTSEELPGSRRGISV